MSGRFAQATVAMAVATATLLASGGALGHGTETNGSILVPFTDSSDSGAFSTVRGTVNSNFMNGIASWNVPVTAGNDFLLEDTCCGADFDVTFTNGAYNNGPGDEFGTIPGTGWAVVTLFFGPPGSTFKFHEY